MKQKHIFISGLAVGLFLLSLGLTNPFLSSAQSEQVVCSNSSGSMTPISQYRCGIVSNLSVTCPASKADQFLVFQSGGPIYVDCIGLSEMEILVPDMTCRRSNGQTYFSKRTNGCYQGDSAIQCPTGYTPTNQMCLSSSSPSPSPVSSLPTNNIVCADPLFSHKQSQNSFCMVWSKSRTIAISCTNAGEVIRRDGSQEVCVSSALIKSTEKKCSFENMVSHKQIEIYATECPATAPPPPPPPPPTPPPSTTTDTKPTVTPLQLSEPSLQCPATKGLCRKGAVQECLTVCPVGWDFTLPDGFNGTTSKLLGDAYVTGVNAAGKFLEGGDTEVATPEVKIETVKEIIVIEREKIVEVTPIEVPQDNIDDAVCKTVKNNAENAIQERLVILDTFDKAGAEVKSANADVKRASQENIKAGIKELRNINKKNTKDFECSAEHLHSIANSVKEFDDIVIAQARHNLAISKKGERVQPQYFGTRQDITESEKALKRISPEKKAEIATEILNFEQCRKDFGELVLAEGLILESEIRETAELCSSAKKQIALAAKEKSTKPTILKKDTKKKEILKQAAKKKSLKKKDNKKGKKGKKAKKKSVKASKKKTKKAKTTGTREGHEADP